MKRSCAPARASAASRISRSPEQKTRTSPPPSALSSRTASTMPVFWSRLAVLEQRAVAHLDRVRAPRHLDDGRRRAVGAGEVRREPGGVDRGRGDDHPQVGAPGQQLLEVAEQEVDVEAALVRLVHDDRVVAAQVPVTADLGEQHAVGHDLEPRLPRRLPGEADLVADDLAQRRLHLLGHALRDRPGREPAGLGVGDGAAPDLQADLRQLRRLARPGLPRQDHDRVLADQGGDLVVPRRDRQRLVVREVQRRRALPDDSSLTHWAQVSRRSGRGQEADVPSGPGARGREQD